MLSNLRYHGSLTFSPRVVSVFKYQLPPLVLIFLFPLTAPQLPFMYISDAAFKLWTQGDLARVEDIFGEDIIYPSNPFHHARTLAHRALVRSRLKRCDVAIEDAKKVNSGYLSRHVVLTITR